jgi:FixJ family two-component response regulator
MGPSTRGDDVLPEKSFTVIVVDDDESIRRALKRLLTVHGYDVITFESAEEFLDSGGLETEACMVLDMRLPGMSGLELHERLASLGNLHPVIFMTAHDNRSWKEWVSKTDAVAYLRKPFDQQALLDALRLAAARSAPAKRGTQHP